MTPTAAWHSSLPATWSTENTSMSFIPSCSATGSLARHRQSLNNNVTKLRASEGVVLGTFTVGSGPGGLAFDGANMWVANSGCGSGNTVTQLRASNGAVLGTFIVGTSPQSTTFDGANICVTLDGPGGGVTKLRASDGTFLGTFPTGSYPIGLASGGVYMWIANS